ncbi:hypothetical protein GCM10010441_29540 [Kitasatospora paracochleata]|uniref:Uncharacterized protein n=1 Tax=Kitasatospora paracochleata TaxID=58354 RepID=A0ABT1J8Y9_9ACTN|nr:hypothetical protein [Kitasatospora paracochleata]MCP2313915.1 hypothetical protein [Kitasatospora paracochleata]
MSEFPRARITELVALLGAPWRLDNCPYKQDDAWQFVTDGRGRGFWLHIDRGQLEREPAKPHGYRVTARGRYPDIPGHFFTDKGRPEIGFDLSRPLTTLAKDMRRRFLPQFEAAYARAVDELHARSSAADKRAAMARALLDRFPQRGWEGEMRPGVHRVCVDLEPHPGASADLEIRQAGEVVDVQLRNVDPRDLDALWALFERRQAERIAAACGAPASADLTTLDIMRVA